MDGGVKGSKRMVLTSIHGQGQWRTGNSTIELDSDESESENIPPSPAASPSPAAAGKQRAADPDADAPVTKVYFNNWKFKIRISNPRLHEMKNISMYLSRKVNIEFMT
jgi:hypothetical protein